METNIQVNKHTAETMYIDHPTASYGMFCHNSIGDLFLNSDWGNFAFAWRAYSGEFKNFLASLDVDYMVGKFAINYRELTNKPLPKVKEQNIKILCQEFINQLKKEIKS